MTTETVETAVKDTARAPVHAIPAELQPYKAGLPAGLFYLAIGRDFPDVSEYTAIPRAACKSTRFRVDGPTSAWLDALTARTGSERQAVITALAWIASQPKQQIPTLLSMTF